MVMEGSLVEGMPQEGLPVAVGESPLNFGLNLVSRLAGFWMVWVILSIMLHIGLMIGGGSVPNWRTGLSMNPSLSVFCARDRPVQRARDPSGLSKISP